MCDKYMREKKDGGMSVRNNRTAKYIITTSSI